MTPEQLKKEVENLLEFKNEMKVHYASRTGGGMPTKKLFVTFHGFIIEVDGVQVWAGTQAFSAIERYYEL